RPARLPRAPGACRAAHAPGRADRPGPGNDRTVPAAAEGRRPGLAGRASGRRGASVPRQPVRAPRADRGGAGRTPADEPARTRRAAGRAEGTALALEPAPGAVHLAGTGAAG